MPCRQPKLVFNRPIGAAENGVRQIERTNDYSPTTDDHSSLNIDSCLITMRSSQHFVVRDEALCLGLWTEPQDDDDVSFRAPRHETPPPLYTKSLVSLASQTLSRHACLAQQFGSCLFALFSTEGCSSLTRTSQFPSGVFNPSFALRRRRRIFLRLAALPRLRLLGPSCGHCVTARPRLFSFHINRNVEERVRSKRPTAKLLGGVLNF